MLRALAFGMAFLAILAFQFFIFPGHSYLAGDSLLYVPILEHLDHPGLLSRDLLATHPNVTYTIYDEAALFMERVAHLSLRQVLLGQLLVFRAWSLAGGYLLARSLGLRSWLSLAVAALVQCGAYLPGLDVHLVDREPVPSTFAFSAIVLATGLLATRRPLAGALAAGAAMLYDISLAVPFLLVLCVCAAFDRLWRRMLRGSVAVLFAFGLLLANLAQLQPDVPEPARLLDRIPTAIEAIQRFALPQLWLSLWTPAALLWYLELLLFCAVVSASFRQHLKQPALALYWGLLAIALCAVVFSFAVLEGGHWQKGPVLQPLRTLMFLAAIASVFFWAACLAGWHSRPRWANAALLVLATTLPLMELVSRFPLPHEPDIQAVAHWAEANTWGGAMFLFADAGRTSYPAVFRAEAERAIWTDWESRKQAAYFDSFADEWYRRWQDTMSGDYSNAHLQRLLSLPIDYYVLRLADQLSGVLPVYKDSQFVVYDAHDLREHDGCDGCLY